VDLSEYAIQRAKRLLSNSDSIEWIQADMLRDDLFSIAGVEKGAFDFVFDMQCFHVVRSIDESRAVDVLYSVLRPGGRAMVVVGAPLEAGEPVFVNGPPILTQEELLAPFLGRGFELIRIYSSRFNDTPKYSAELPHPPRCWVALFQKPGN
jgi:SAM-dependent methyltransferase